MHAKRERCTRHTDRTRGSAIAGSGDSHPAYVDRGGEQVHPTPGDVENAELYGFLVEADTAAIQTHVCHALFNRPAGGAVDFARAVGGAIQEAAGFGGFSVQDCARMWSFRNDLMKRQVPLVFLKQFRAVDDPARACFQAITTANMRPTGFRGGRPLNGTDAVTVADYPSHPIRRDIGLASETLTARFSFYIHFDFRIETGRQLWAAAT